MADVAEQPPATPIPRPIKLAFGVLLVVVGLGVIALGVAELRRTIALRSADTHVQATVLERRIDTSTNVGGHRQVRYRFKVDGHTYSYADATRRHDLWATVRHDEWDEAEHTHRVDVVYDEDDPWISAPASAGVIHIADAGAGAVVGVLLLGFGIAVLRKLRAS
jgi:hypothetical protein